MISPEEKEKNPFPSDGIIWEVWIPPQKKFFKVMHVFSPENAFKLELPWRYEVLPPEATLTKLGVRQGMTVVDIGAGTGFFTRAAAAIAGEKGRVIATDISHEMLGILGKNGLPENVELLHTGTDAIALGDGCADFVLAAFVVHEIRDVHRFMDEVIRILKPAGMLAIIEWKKQDEEHGPPEEERLDAVDLRKRLDGFTNVEEGSLNESHYFIRIQKATKQ